MSGLNQLSTDEGSFFSLFIHISWHHMATDTVHTQTIMKNGMTHNMWHSHHTCNLIIHYHTVLLDNLLCMAMVPAFPSYHWPEVYAQVMPKHNTWCSLAPKTGTWRKQYLIRNADGHSFQVPKPSKYTSGNIKKYHIQQGYRHMWLSAARSPLQWTQHPSHHLCQRHACTDYFGSNLKFLGIFDPTTYISSHTLQGPVL